MLLLLILLMIGIGGYVPQIASSRSLSDQYIQALRYQIGIPYKTAESRSVGLSCSQLARTAYLQTSAPKESKQIIRDRACLSPEMRAGCFGQLEVIAEASGLPALDAAQLSPGDVVVIGNETALHTVVYLGAGEWIDADPVRGRVGTFRATDRNVWFIYRATLLRWKALK